MAAIAPKIHAILVGMDRYENHKPTFNRAIQDVNAMRNFLITLGVDKKNIQTFKKAKLATKPEIMKSVASLKENANRGDPIIFYYSGLMGTTKVGERLAAMICPYDVLSHQGGIPDIALIQMFDELAPFCGNNISVFLDCSIQNFAFGNPLSCIVMGPDKSADIGANGAFTQAMIKVLSDIHGKHQPLNYMTVQSFSAHVQASIQSPSFVINIRCAGSNVDRPLFDLTAEKGQYALVAGRVHIDGRILLNAGTAHGIRPGAVYGIYTTNMRSRLEDGSTRIGELRVVSSNKDDLTTTLESTDLKVPPFFFAVEERDAFEPFTISCTTDVEKYLKSCSGWKISSTPTAILKKTEDHVIMTWKGLPGDTGIRSLERKEYTDIEEDLDYIQPTILRAARFCSQLAEPSGKYLAPSKLLVRLQKVDLGQELEPSAESPDTEQTNLLDDQNFKPQHVFLDIPWKLEDDPVSYTLTITNKNAFDVWLYVYLFDVQSLTIEPCYEASSGTPLKRDQKLIIGTSDIDTYFHHRDDKDYDFAYLKIFVARDPMELRFIRQLSTSSEDRLRRFDSGAQQADNISEASADSAATSPEPIRRNHVPSSKWASMTIRITNDYTSKI